MIRKTKETDEELNLKMKLGLGTRISLSHSEAPHRLANGPHNQEWSKASPAASDNDVARKSCILKVNIHCEGCEQKVKKLLHKVDGVYSVNVVDAESGRVLVAGNVDPAKLIKKLKGSGKHAEIWGGQRGVNVYHQNQNFALTNQFKNMQIDPSRMGKHNDSQKNWKNQQKGQPVQQLAQFQNKGAKDLMKPHKSVKFNLPQDDFHASDDGLDEFDEEEEEEFDDDFDEEEEEEEELGHRPGNPMAMAKPMMMPNKMNMNMMGNGRGPHGPGGMMKGPGGMMNGPGNKGKGGSGGKNKKGDVIDLGIEIKGKGGKKGESEWGGGKKEKGGKQKAGNNKKKNGKSSSGSGGLLGFLGFGKKSKKGGGGGDSSSTPKFKKNGVPIGNYKPKNKGQDFKKIEHHDFEFDIPMKGKSGKGGNGNSNNGMGKMGPSPMGNNYPMEQMRAVQGLPATGANGGYYPGIGMQMPMTMQSPHPLPYNQQQQYMAMMMNQQQQQLQGNMYGIGRAQGHINYMPPPPMPSHPMADPITHVFSDENTESCTIM
ncbi:heavy metal-associated isoprenylated plant protein 34-like [Senna tora]|uniref:Heavy metal-associated isoprenylated plant protein 34-like n=1 Tax=Senna tora TaxID=362788 RepID=A0A834SK49_9FABA|nr:heavy metal-associated isoprenylated plant protein 34-like [Senna tora]